MSDGGFETERGAIASLAVRQSKVASCNDPIDVRDWRRLVDHVIENGALLLVGITRDGVVVSVNDSACRVMGYERDYLARVNFWDLLYPGELHRQVDDLFRHFEIDKSVHEFPMTLQTATGERRVISWTSINRFDSGGELVEIIGLGIDITVSEENAQALIKAEQHLAQAQRVARIGSWELDLANDRYWWSDEALRILESDRNRPIESYTAFLDLVHPDDRASVNAAYSAALAERTGYDAIFRVIREDGTPRYVQGLCHTEYDAQGNALRSMGTVQDITERVAQERKLNDTLAETIRISEYTDHVVENSPTFIVATGPDGTTKAINEAGCRYMECTREQILGTDLWRAMYPGNLYAQVPVLFEQFEQDGGVKDYEMVMRSFAGTERTLAWTSVNRIDDDGNVTEIIGIGIDLTELRRSEALLSEAQEIAGLGSWSYDTQSGLMHWSVEALRVLELEKNIVGTTMESILALIDPEDRAAIEESYPDALKSGVPYDFSFRLSLSDGRVKHIRSRCRNTPDDDGVVRRSVGTVQDITAEVEQKQKLQAALDETVKLKAYHEHVVENSPAVIAAIGRNGLTTAINSSGCAILGYPREEIIGRDFWTLVCPGKKYRQVESLFREYERCGQVRNFEMVIETALGDERVWSWNSVNRLDAKGRLIEAVGIAADVTDLKRSQSELQYLAHHDPLTGLPNRLLLGARLEHAIEQARRRNKSGALLFVDLDRFKNINDSLGHPVGDALLRAAAQRLKNCVRGADTVARLSGDEFTLLLEDIDGIESAVAIAEKILETFCNPFSMEGHEVVVTPSIGISLFPDDSNDTDSLLRNADSAMYEAKDKGRNAYAIYSKRLTDTALERVHLENDLRRALDHDELVVYYQPQVDLADGRLIGAEALLRWNHPDKGLIPPDHFIPLAEESGLIIPIGEWVLQRACHQAKAWLDAGINLGRIAVNVAGPQIQRSDLARLAAAALTESGLPASKLELEVTEGFIMREAEHAIHMLNALRDLGVSLSIDDFGTGYSSLSYLKRLPVNQLKIDRSFVRDIPSDSDDMAITEAVIALALSLRLDVLAEGVESTAQREFLLSRGCRHGQGYLFQRPVTADEFLRWAQAAPGA